MKAVYTGMIKEFSRTEGPGGYGDVICKIACEGKVENKNIASQKTSIELNLTIKQLVADNLKIGTVLTITVSDEDFKSDKVKEWAE